MNNCETEMGVAIQPVFEEEYQEPNVE